MVPFQWSPSTHGWETDSFNLNSSHWQRGGPPKYSILLRKRPHLPKATELSPLSTTSIRILLVAKDSVHWITPAITWHPHAQPRCTSPKSLTTNVLTVDYIQQLLLVSQDQKPSKSPLSSDQSSHCTPHIHIHRRSRFSLRRIVTKRTHFSYH
jgi:hypothetical protein